MVSDLPGDLELEILSRVPATSLSRLRFTCKRWYALFKDPKFIKKNLGKGVREVILVKHCRVYSVIINIHGVNNSFDPSIEFTGKLRENSEDVKAYQKSQCDSLLLCTTDEERLVVLNPCTGQTRWIQATNLKRTKYFLGYGNKSSRDFKILSLGCSYGKINANLYESNSDSWKDLHDVDPSCLIQSNGVTLKGNTYWFASDFENVKFILRFDFETERFGRLSLPFESEYCDENVVLSVVRDEKLALLYQVFDIESLEMKIWVTKIDDAKDLLWSNFLVVDFGKFMIRDMTGVMSFLVDEENKMVVYMENHNDETIIFVVGEDVHKEVYKETSTGFDRYMPLLISYLPSLAQIPAKVK